MESFKEYMWYLLLSPFKKAKQAVNAWWIWCKVFGRWFDSCLEDLFRAREESMVATARELLLPIHAADRGLVRYAGEEVENFRSRIAMHEELCRLGGVNQGILLAVKTLGYSTVTIIPAKDYKGDAARWAEFYILLPMNIEDAYPIGYDILKKNVRLWKEVGAKDNYQFIFQDTNTVEKITDIYRVVLKAVAEIQNRQENNIMFRTAAENQLDSGLILTIRNNLWYLDGSNRLDGGKILNAYEKMEEL